MRAAAVVSIGDVGVEVGSATVEAGRPVLRLAQDAPVGGIRHGEGVVGKGLEVGEIAGSTCQTIQAVVLVGVGIAPPECGHSRCGIADGVDVARLVVRVGDVLQQMTGTIIVI